MLYLSSIDFDMLVGSNYKKMSLKEDIEIFSDDITDTYFEVMDDISDNYRDGFESFSTDEMLYIVQRVINRLTTKISDNPIFPYRIWLDNITIMEYDKLGKYHHRSVINYNKSTRNGRNLINVMDDLDKGLKASFDAEQIDCDIDEVVVFIINIDILSKELPICIYDTKRKEILHYGFKN